MARTRAGDEDRRKCVIRFCSAGLRIRGRRLLSGEGALGGVKFIDHDTVEAQIGDVREAIARGKPDPVRVRAFLALFVGAEGTSVLDERGVRAEFSVREDREYSDIAGRVVGDEDVLSGFVEGYVARIFTER